MRIYYSRKKVACYVVTSAARISLFFGQARHFWVLYYTLHKHVILSNKLVVWSRFLFWLCFRLSFRYCSWNYLVVQYLVVLVGQLSSTRKAMCIKTIIRKDERKLIWTTTMGIPQYASGASYASPARPVTSSISPCQNDYLPPQPSFT